MQLVQVKTQTPARGRLRRGSTMVRSPRTGCYKSYSRELARQTATYVPLAGAFPLLIAAQA